VRSAFHLDTLVAVAYICQSEKEILGVTARSTHPYADDKEAFALFRRFTNSEFTRLSRLLHSLDLAGHQTVYQQDAPAVSFYLLKSGTLSLQRCGEDGKIHRLAIVPAGRSLGRAALWPEESRHPETALTLEPCILLALVRQDFLMLQKKEPALALKLLTALQQEIYQEWLDSRIEFHALTARLNQANILL